MNSSALGAILASMNDTEFRKELGARLLVARIQVKRWNESEAAAAAKIAPKTIRRIERGENYEVESIEKYAAALGKPLSAWIADVLLPRETQRADATAGSAFPSSGTEGR